MEGKVLKDTINTDGKIRNAALFGYHGAHVNITDGRYVYMRSPIPQNFPLYEYTLMPTHMRNMFSVNELKTMELAEPFSFTKGCKTMKIKARGIEGNTYIYGTLLFDLQNDPKQENPIIDSEIEKRMIKLLIELMNKNDAPFEQYERLGIPIDGDVTNEHLNLMNK